MGIRLNSASGNYVTYLINAGLGEMMVSGDALQTFSILFWYQSEFTLTNSTYNHNLLNMKDASGASVVNLQILKSAAGNNPSLLQYVYGGSGTITKSISNQTAPAARKIGLYGLLFSGAKVQFFKRDEDDVAAVSSNYGAAATAGVIQVPTEISLGGSAPPGVWWGLVIRNHAITAADLDYIWSLHTPQAIHSADNTGSGGNMNGGTGSKLWFDNGMMTVPILYDSTLPSALGISTYPKLPLISTTLVYDAYASANPTEARVMRPIQFKGSDGKKCRFVAADDPYWNQGFFTKSAALTGTLDPDVSGTSAKLRRLALDNPSGLIRVVMMDKSYSSHPGYAGSVDGVDYCSNWIGGMANKLKQVAGFDNVQFAEGTYDAWMAMRDATSPPKCTPAPTNSVAGGLTLIASQTEKSMGRDGWSGNGRGTGLGPHFPVALAAGATYRMMVQPFKLLTAGRRMRQVVHYRDWPKGGRFRWRTAQDASFSQTASEVLGDWSSWIDTATTDVLAAHVVTAGEAASYNAGTKTLVLEGTGYGLTHGMVMCRGTYDLANIASVTEATDTTIVFDHAFSVAPVESETLSAGERVFQTLTVDHDGVDPDDLANHRGIEIECETGGNPLVMDSTGAWAMGVNGWILCAGGWGGHQYADMRDETNATGPSGTSSDGPITKYWQRILRPDICILGDNASATTDELDFMGDLAELTCDAVDVLFFGRWFATNVQYPNRARAVAITRGSPYVCVAAGAGNSYDWYANGWTADGTHQSVFGSSEQMRQMLTSLKAATTGAAIGDEVPTSAADVALAVWSESGRSLDGDLQGKVLGGGASTITGTGARVVDASGNAVATAAAQTTAQNDLDLITGADGAVLATSQPNYAPAKAGDQMDLVDAPNATAITAFVTAIWSALTSGITTVGSVGKYIIYCLAAIKLKTDLITTGAITVSAGAYVAADGTTLTLVQGEAYLNAIGSAIPLNGTDTRLTSARMSDGTTVTLRCKSTEIVSIVGTIIDITDAGVWSARFDMTAAQSASLTASPAGTWELEWQIGGVAAYNLNSFIDRTLVVRKQIA